MQIIIDYPPNIDKIKKRFDLTGKKPVFCYGDKLYNPHNAYISRELQIHEATHTLQQGDNVEGWWDRYLTDDKFRLEEELEAYSYQYKAFCDRVSDRNQRARYLNSLCIDLSSAMYGDIIGYIDALKILRLSTQNIINGQNTKNTRR